MNNHIIKVDVLDKSLIIYLSNDPNPFNHIQIHINIRGMYITKDFEIAYE